MQDDKLEKWFECLIFSCRSGLIVEILEMESRFSSQKMGLELE